MLEGFRRVPSLLFLHGNPQTHLTWHAVAPALAQRFIVVASEWPRETTDAFSMFFG